MSWIAAVIIGLAYGNINLSSLVSLHTFLNKEKCCLDVLTLSFVAHDSSIVGQIS